MRTSRYYLPEYKNGECTLKVSTLRETKKYLRNSADWVRESITNYIKALQKNEVAQDRIRPWRSFIWKYKRDLIVIRYTLGESLDTLAKDFDKLFNTIEDWDGCVMYEIIPFISLCVLFNIPKEKIEKVESLLNKRLAEVPNCTSRRYPIYYWLVDFLLKKVQGKRCQEYTTDTIKNRIPFYTDICTALSSGKNVEEAIKTFVTAWTKTPASKHYSGSAGEKNEKSPLAWCFEGAALAAIFNIAPTVFAKEVCFPPDLVEYYKSGQK
jgi:hypothetical protein